MRHSVVSLVERAFTCLSKFATGLRQASLSRLQVVLNGCTCVCVPCLSCEIYVGFLALFFNIFYMLFFFIYPYINSDLSPLDIYICFDWGDNKK